jgi:hypothetical protein
MNETKKSFQIVFKFAFVLSSQVCRVIWDGFSSSFFMCSTSVIVKFVLWQGIVDLEFDIVHMFNGMDSQPVMVIVPQLGEVASTNYLKKPNA